MKRISVLLLLLTTMLYSSGPVMTPQDQQYQTTVYDEVNKIIERAKNDCAQCMYDTVKHAIDMVSTVTTDTSMYEKVAFVFNGVQMKHIIKVGSNYCPVAVLYNAAAQIAYRYNDIDSMIVFSIAAQQERNRAQWPFLFGGGMLVGGLVGFIVATLISSARDCYS